MVTLAVFRIPLAEGANVFLVLTALVVVGSGPVRSQVLFAEVGFVSVSSDHIQIPGPTSSL